MSSRAGWCAARSNLRCGATSRPIRGAPTIPAAARQLWPDHRRGVSRNARRGPRVAAEQASDLALGGIAINRIARPRDADMQARQRGFRCARRSSACIARSFLLPVGRAHQQECLAAVGAGAHLGLDAVPHLPPIGGISQLGREALQLALAGSDQIMPLAALQPCDVLGAGHAAVHHPHTRGLAVAALHRADDLLHGRHIGAIAGERTS